MLDLSDALTVAGQVDLLVGLSEEAPFRPNFSEVPQYVRCAVRYDNDPGLGYRDVGFRVVVSPSNSGR